MRAEFARAAAADGIVLGAQTFDWLCEQAAMGHPPVVRIAAVDGDGAAAYARHRAALISYLIR